MAIAQKKQIIPDRLEKGWEGEIVGIIKRHGLSDDEANRIRKISKDFYVSPERVVATIVLNQFTENGVKSWLEMARKSNDDRYRKMAAIAYAITSPGAERILKKEWVGIVSKLREEKFKDYYRSQYG